MGRLGQAAIQEMVQLIALLLLTVFGLVKSLPDQIENLNFGTFGLKSPLNHSNEVSEFRFEHGIASGDPTTHSIILWTRLTPEFINKSIPLSVFVKISSSPYFEKDCQEYSVVTNHEIDYTIKVDIDNLEPGKFYYYQFFANNGESTRVGRTKTLPADEYNGKVKFGVYSCSNYAGGFFTAYAMPALKDSIDYAIHLGDYIYEHANGDYTNGTSLGRTHMPDREMWNLVDYRERYAYYHLDKDLQLSHAMFPWILVWDDHEIADNSWQRGSVNSEGWSFVARKQAGMRAYFEWLPIRPQKNPYKIWRELKFGKQLDLMMLDTRHYSRDVTDIYTNGAYIASIANRSERTMMGFDQEHWLYKSLNESNANWRVIGSQTVVNHVDFTSVGKIIGHPFEHYDLDSFDGYLANRRRLYETILENNITDTVIVSGDFHIAWAHELFLDANKYDPKTGEGSLLVEFATSATSSPSTFPRGYSIEQCHRISNKLVDSNKGIIWNEGWFRGYFEMEVGSDQIDVGYFGVNVSNSNREEFSLANFTVERGASRISRNFGGQPSYGYLDARVI